jgi:hypothetical protein
MAERQVECALLERTSQLARGKGLLENGKGNQLNCAYRSTCNGLSCRLMEEPQTRTLYLGQNGKDSVPSGQERFYQRLENRSSVVSIKSKVNR